MSLVATQQFCHFAFSFSLRCPIPREFIYTSTHVCQKNLYVEQSSHNWVCPKMVLCKTFDQKFIRQKTKLRWTWLDRGSLGWLHYEKRELSFTNLLMANKLADVSTRCSNLLQDRERRLKHLVETLASLLATSKLVKENSPFAVKMTMATYT